MQHAVLIGQIEQTLQEKSYTLATFSAKINDLRHRGGFRSDAAFCRFVGLSRTHLTEMRSGRQPISEKTIRKLSDAELRLAKSAKMADSNLEEPPGKYGNNPPPNRNIAGDTSSLKLNTGFRTTPGEPTAEDCISYLAAYVADARFVPGAIGRTWFELQRIFPLAEIKRLRAEGVSPEDIKRDDP